jgi:GNAT superfamily N-acetyltransferase
MQDVAPQPACCIRPATRADVPALFPLWRDMMRSHRAYDAAFSLATDAADSWRQATGDMVARHDSFVLLAEQGAGAVGFITGWIAYNPPIYEARVVGLISEIAVCRHARHRGVGRSLVAAARAWFLARELGEFQLSTAIRNAGARAFWQAQGGKPLLVRYRFDTASP